MKTVYFVRHGSTEQLEARAWQLHDIPLSEKGRTQAISAARRFQKIPIDIIITSEMERARETARYISDATKTDVVESPLFHEILRPTVNRGKLHSDPIAWALGQEVECNFELGTTSKHSDEENFYDLRDRAISAIKFIEEYPEENICVVTHGTFLRMMLVILLFGNEVTAQQSYAIHRFFYPSNTGITTCTLEDTKWWLRTWNDDAHLGEVEEN